MNENKIIIRLQEIINSIFILIMKFILWDINKLKNDDIWIKIEIKEEI